MPTLAPPVPSASPVRSVLSLSLLNDLSPGATSHRPYNGLNISQGHLKKRENLRTQGKRYTNATTIDMLTDNVLLEIFDFCRKDHDQCPSGPIWKWYLLAHVSWRWRQIISASPRRLNLEILCRDRTPVRKNLGIWPVVPIVMRYGQYDWDTVAPDDEDNVIAALEHPDRVCRIGLHITRSQLRRITKAMQEPFPVLTRLSISTEDEYVPIIPSRFLAGSAPCLREIKITSIPFPALPTFLLSVSDLVELKLHQIPRTGYISPEVMVAHLAALPRLKILDIGFLTPSPLPGRTPPPLTRTVLPALNYFAGACEYMEDFVALIDAPQLRSIEICYFDPIVFGVPRLSEFINRSESLKRTLSRHCQVMIDDTDDTINQAINCYIGATTDKVQHREPETGIYVYFLCHGMDRKFLHLALVFGCISPVLDIIHFAINSETLEPWLEPPFSPEDVDYFEWLHLHTFSSVQTLFVAAIFAGRVSPVLEDIAGDPVTEFLPALELLCLEDQPISSVDQFLAARRDSGHPVTIVNTKEEFEKRLEAYPP
ncbi:hypothetical protein EDB89DRAFT_2230940 [Lactarius sanguifluus]|nr:hypothetical protein EDB89DRAFT_2230940 [Lactarius sanguifluus]